MLHLPRIAPKDIMTAAVAKSAAISEVISS
jgi:hypothetical protein